MKRKIYLAVTGIIIIGTLFLTLRAVLTSQSASASGSDLETPIHVTGVAVSRGAVASIDYVGTVKAIDLIKVLPGAAGQIITSKVTDGAVVKQGDILFELGGMNGIKHQLQSQYELAQTAFNNARKAVDAVKEGNAAALKSAQLQVQSANHQAQAMALDLDTYSGNIDAAQSGMFILQNSLDATRYNNQQNFDKADLSIQSLDESLHDLEDQRDETISDLYDQLDQVTDQTKRAELQKQIDTASDTFDQKVRDLNTQLNAAQISYGNVEAAAQLAENQIQAQLVTSQAQQNALNLTRDSLQLKAGYNGSTTDAVEIAREGAAATVSKNKASLLQAQAALDAAAINLEAAKNQLSLLSVHAPISGIITQVSVRPGDVVSTQTVAAQIVRQSGFELNVGVNADDVEKINKAEIRIGGKYVEVAVKTVSPIADPASKLVNVTLSLPNIFFRANQTLNARISFNQPQSVTADHAFMIPVDALVIGDANDKYVFISDNGKARKMAVSVGEIRGDEIEVLSGISENDQVIVRGSQDLTDGQTVTMN